MGEFLGTASLDLCRLLSPTACVGKRIYVIIGYSCFFVREVAGHLGMRKSWSNFMIMSWME